MAEKLKRNVKQVGIRLSTEERQLVDDACAAVSTAETLVSPGQLFYTAGLEEAAALGFTTSGLGTDIRAPKGVWKNKPERSYGSLNPGEERKAITITIHPLHYAPIAKAADWVEVKVPTFLWGSLMVFLAKRKKAEPRNTRLQAISLPAQYEPR